MTKKHEMRLLILFFIIFSACKSTVTERNNPEINNETISQNEKELIFKNLTRISLPFESKCGADLKVPEQTVAKNFINDLPENLRFIGLLKETENFLATILVDTYADYQIHYLTTISKEGKIIEKFDLFSYGCAEDEFFNGKADYKIFEDLTIIQTDSSSTYKRDGDGQIILETIETRANKFEYFVDKDGRIKK